MAYRAIALCGLVACYAPELTPGLPCAPLGVEPRCPAGFQCVDRGGEEVCTTDPGPDVDAPTAADAPFDAPPGQPDASVDGSVPTDTDGDGVDDAVDNCVGDPNMDQADEDGDGPGDVCDPCPPFADNSDPDGDGVGGPCDPDSGAAGHSIVAFTGFASGFPAGWTATGMISAAGGDAIVTSNSAEALLVTPAPVGPLVVVTAQATTTSLATSIGGMGVIQRRAGVDTGVACQLVANSGGTTQVLRIFDLNGVATLDEAAHPVVLDAPYVLSMSLAGNAVTCGVDAPPVEIGVTTLSGAGAPGAGLRTRNAGVRYAWVLIVRGP